MNYGEWIVGKSFNPSKDSLVDEVKELHAELINKLGEIIEHENIDDSTDEMDNIRKNEVIRLVQSAISCIEMSSMYSVKALTKPKPEF